MTNNFGCIYVQVFELVCLQFDLWYQFRDNREQMSWALNLWVKIVHHLFHISYKQTTTVTQTFQGDLIFNLMFETKWDGSYDPSHSTFQIWRTSRTILINNSVSPTYLQNFSQKMTSFHETQGKWQIKPLYFPANSQTLGCPAWVRCMHNILKR